MTVEHARTLHSPNQHIHTLNDRVWRLERDRCDCTKIPTSQPADIVLGDTPPPPPPPPQPPVNDVVSKSVWVLDYSNGQIWPATRSGNPKPGTVLKAPGLYEQRGGFNPLYYDTTVTILRLVDFRTDGGSIVGDVPWIPNIEGMWYAGPLQVILEFDHTGLHQGRSLVVWDPQNSEETGSRIDVSTWLGRGLSSWKIDPNGELAALKLGDDGITVVKYGKDRGVRVNYKEATDGFQVWSKCPTLDGYAVYVNSVDANRPGPKHFRLLNISTGNVGMDFKRGVPTDNFTHVDDDIVDVIPSGLVKSDGHIRTTTSVEWPTRVPVPDVPGYELASFSAQFNQAVLIKPGEGVRTAKVFDTSGGGLKDMSSVKVNGSRDYGLIIRGNLQFTDADFWS